MSLRVVSPRSSLAPRDELTSSGVQCALMDEALAARHCAGRCSSSLAAHLLSLAARVFTVTVREAA